MRFTATPFRGALAALPLDAALHAPLVDSSPFNLTDDGGMDTVCLADEAQRLAQNLAAAAGGFGPGSPAGVSRDTNCAKARLAVLWQWGIKPSSASGGMHILQGIVGAVDGCALPEELLLLYIAVASFCCQLKYLHQASIRRKLPPPAALVAVLLELAPPLMSSETCMLLC
jgi:hypothetical protein